MRVGISIMTGSGQNLWNNGLGQNIFHLACLIEAIPFVEGVYLLNCGKVAELPSGTDDAGKHYPLITLSEAADIIDVAIEQGGVISPEWIRRFRARGGKVVRHICGQPYGVLIESMVFARDVFFEEPEQVDEVWLLAKDMMFSAMMRTIHRAPIHEMPYLWSPRFLEDTVKRNGDQGGSFGYKVGSLTKGLVRPAIFEPNMSPIKMSLIPLLICQEADHQEPGLIDRLNLLNGDHMISHPAFVAFIQNLALYRAGKLIITGRDYFARVMMQGGNVVISHQINCCQNYLYLDALYGGYPLVHNSSFFQDVGYYYEASNVMAGAAALLRAVAIHDRDFALYVSNAQTAISRLSPTKRANVDIYARRLAALAGDRQIRKFA